MSTIRTLWTAAGFASFGLGAVGVVVPLLPTVPFMLLAAFCFARGSDRFHDWLVNHPQFGPAIQDWQAHGAISRRGKIAAIVAACITFGISLALGLAGHILAIQAVVLGAMLVFVLSRPTAPAHPSPASARSS